jgi:hypothetical protein
MFNDSVRGINYQLLMLGGGWVHMQKEKHEMIEMPTWCVCTNELNAREKAKTSIHLFISGSWEK